VLADFRSDITLRVVIDVEQNRKLSEVLNALNPKLAKSVINARQEGTTTALTIKEALDEKSLVTLLADRARPGNQVMTVDFLGRPAPFPTAPWQLAAALKVPVVLCFGLYRGGNRSTCISSPSSISSSSSVPTATPSCSRRSSASPTGWLTTRAARRTIGPTFMTSGAAPMSITRRLLPMLAPLLLATPAAALDADALIAKLARPAPASIAFTEVRVSALLREPLWNSRVQGVSTVTCASRIARTLRFVANRCASSATASSRAALH
jgi:hypothetical protein